MPPHSSISISGQTFSDLTAIEFHSKPANWLFECICGTQKVLAAYGVVHGRTKSCGCRRHRGSRTTHGESGKMSRTPEYISWTRMKERCLTSSSVDYPNYGGRGIGICEEWLDYSAFLEDMGRRPSLKHSLERKNVNKGYSLENCHWAGPQEQARNKRNTIMVFVEDRWEPVVAVAERLGVTPKTIRYRNAGKLKKLGEILDQSSP